MVDLALEPSRVLRRDAEIGLRDVAGDIVTRRRASPQKLVQRRDELRGRLITRSENSAPLAAQQLADQPLADKAAPPVMKTFMSLSLPPVVVLARN